MLYKEEENSSNIFLCLGTKNNNEKIDVKLDDYSEGFNNGKYIVGYSEITNYIFGIIQNEEVKQYAMVDVYPTKVTFKQNCMYYL